MTVIAMTREMGSMGRDVALAVAEKLGLELVQHELVEHVAEKMQVRESSVNRFLEGTAGLFERWGINESDLSLFTREEILDIAERGDVLFRGWGAGIVLRHVPHVLCVRVCAPEMARAKELMQRIRIDDLTIACKEVRKNDAAHDRAMSHLFHADWKDPLLYDLVLNTERVSVESCVELVLQAAARNEFKPSDASKARLKDLRIEASIRAALHQNADTNRPNPSFEVTVEPGSGRVTLSGVVFDHTFRCEALDVVAAVPGVTDVVDEMVVPGPAQVGP